MHVFHLHTSTLVQKKLCTILGMSESCTSQFSGIYQLYQPMNVRSPAVLSPYPKSVTRGSVTLPRYMDFDTAHTTSRESTSFWGSNHPARGYARETRVTPRRRPLVDATRSQFVRGLIFWIRARPRAATTRTRTRTRTVSFADRARARRGVLRRRDAGAVNVDRKPYFLGFRKRGAS